jgi:hypothetical protein
MSAEIHTDRKLLAADSARIPGETHRRRGIRWFREEHATATAPVLASGRSAGKFP